MKRLISWLVQHVPRQYLQLLAPIARVVLGWLYHGNSVQCPICTRSFRSFLPYGRGRFSRENALCPGCLSLERHRLMYMYLQQRTTFFTEQLSVLHIAPEACFIKRFRQLPNINYLTTDLVSPWADVKADIQALPFEPNRFDVVFCNHVLEHIPDDKQAMREIYRVLQVGGWAILQVPFMQGNLITTYEDSSIQSPAAREQAFGQADHLRLYGSDYATRLEKAGFKVTQDRFVTTLEDALIHKHGLPATEVIFVGRKKSLIQKSNKPA